MRHPADRKSTLGVVLPTLYLRTASQEVAGPAKHSANSPRDLLLSLKVAHSLQETAVPAQNPGLSFVSSISENREYRKPSFREHPFSAAQFLGRPSVQATREYDACGASPASSTYSADGYLAVRLSPSVGSPASFQSFLPPV